MNENFIYKKFSRTDGDYELVVITDGDVLVPARIVGDSAYIQTTQTTGNEQIDPEGAMRRVKRFLETEVCEYAHVV